jgi:hypothetical protein
VIDQIFTMMSEDPEMGPSLRDADVPQRFEFKRVLPGQGERRGGDRAAADQDRRRRQGGALADPDHEARPRARYRALVEAEYPHLKP